MPTYQYQCTECGEGLEAVQKFTDDALTECPACNGRLKKVFSAVGIVFKGSGFYRNDSRGSSSSSTPATSKSSSDAKSSSDTKSSSGSSSSSSSSSDSKSSSSGSSSTSSTSAA
ncbi:FmdB family zinc ribbon protein [Streptomyces europaeiscabiei]|uniref:Zinc ribbon domain-containing protein n=1 Tax=Streptomyces europaeiscabiei TaxID=146819 RepID=A0ABU4NPF4_9ACTN|nr:FmdB family zinc ribbon protein [Streptomyces europaeiscabiei]MDX2522858.1 zinc ribbon domain-containing protein [Streptomyces europaeiscabiei]MDX2758804.1 zinc ribbon domain-containing protein [Streptomyces europaeiscabiei]MDX3547102.1 zinc ribbon domain-containing protein [Streptomyces europaeiscabiei]MDX3556977.1 zinc ribbon domain-containing protein [Streptomyces europaeiscabiei]MDX3669953.1 zinc ribbon domain-containing protein [Streptomyces europaeiscabiei]